KQKKTESDTTKPIKEITEVKLQMILKLRPRNRQVHIRETPESDGMKPTKTPPETTTQKKEELVSQTRNALEQKAIIPRSPPKSTADSITATKTDSTPPETITQKKEKLVSQTRNAIEQKAKIPRSPLKSTADSITATKTNSILTNLSSASNNELELVYKENTSSSAQMLEAQITLWNIAKKMKFKKLRTAKRLEIAWSLPLENGKLTRISLGNYNLEIIKSQSAFKTTLIGLPKNAKKNLLLRQLGQVQAKALLIPLNSHGNNRKMAIQVKKPVSKIKDISNSSTKTKLLKEILIWLENLSKPTEDNWVTDGLITPKVAKVVTKIVSRQLCLEAEGEFSRIGRLEFNKEKTANLRGCQHLDHELAARQIVALYKQLNQENSWSSLARISIKQKYLNTVLTKEIGVSDIMLDLDLLKKTDESSLTKELKKYNIFYLNQLLTKNSKSLISWQQLMLAHGSNKKEGKQNVNLQKSPRLIMNLNLISTNDTHKEWIWYQNKKNLGEVHRVVKKSKGRFLRSIRAIMQILRIVRCQFWYTNVKIKCLRSLSREDIITQLPRPVVKSCKRIVPAIKDFIEKKGKVQKEPVSKTNSEIV
ncbi:43947_t:CDS:2, partial [Gigaspora margarita]